MAFQNPYEYHNNYGYASHPPGSFDSESVKFQFSNFEQFTYQKESGLQPSEHGIVGPADQTMYNDISQSYDQDPENNSRTMHDFAGFPPTKNFPQTDNAFHPSIPPINYPEASAPVNEQHTANNAASCAVDHSTVEYQGDSSVMAGISDSPEVQPESQTRESVSRQTANRARSSPKVTSQTGSRGYLKTTGRTTVHDRSKIAAKKQQKRPPNPSTADTVKNTENSVSAATSANQTDPFTQWYQMMSQYYSQFYPGYQLPQPPGMANTPASTEESKPTNKQLDRDGKSFAGHTKQTNYMPTQSAYPGRPGAFTTAGIPGNMDYAAYYYQYYYEAAAAAAAQMWSGGSFYPGLDPSGRQTPKLFSTPHVRGGLATAGILLQILPNRPSAGELARIELLDMSVLANDAVAEATKRAAESGNYMSNLTRLNELRLNRDPDETRDAYSSGASELESPERLSSLQAGAGGDDDGEEIRACAAIAVAWDRTDHVLYPGPLSRTSTLKADVLVFLRDKLAEIQDRLPIDWESAGLLLSYLEFMVKNNGNIQPSDLVRLLLEGHEPQTSDLRARCSNTPSGGNSYTGVTIPNGMLQSTRSYLNDSLASLPASQAPSGRQSPQNPYGIPGAKAASETGGFGTSQSLLRRAAAAVTSNQSSRQLEEDRVLDRFRELLMHGMPMKALEHACRSQLWGHAFVLAQRLGPTVFDKVMERFLTRAIPISDPILTLYQLTAGEIPQAVSAAANGRGSDNGDWRPHLAMILASESAQPELTQVALERLGDSLLSRRLIYAAHLCYLLMGPLLKEDSVGCGQQPVYRLPQKIWLLGVPVTTNSVGSDLNASTGHSEGHVQPQNPLNASTEAIQLTEIYEYAMRLANQNYRLPQLLPFKLVYATRLIDAGLLDKAYRYLSAIGQDLLFEASRYEASGKGSVNPILYSMVGNCLRLVEPLQNHPELDGFELSGPPRVSGMGMGLTAGASDGNFIYHLRELYDRMNRQVARAQYTPVIYAASKPSTDTSGSGETAVNTQTVTNQNPPPDQQSQNPQAYADSRHQSLPPASINSSGVETSSTAPPVTAYLVPGHRQSSDSQSFGAGRSEGHAPPHENTEPYTYRQHQSESLTTRPTAFPGPDRPDANTGFMATAPGRRTSSGQCYDPGPQNMAHSRVSTTHAPPSDPRSPLEHSSPASGSVSQSGSYSGQGGSVSGPGYHSNLFGASHTPHGPNGPNTDGIGVPMGQMPAVQSSSTGSEQFQPNSGLFFTPMAPVSNEPTSEGSPPGTPGVFDYFAGIRSTEQTGTRSRTVSGCSQGSAVGGYPHTRSRNSSGLVASRRGSTGYERPSSSASHPYPGPPQTPKHMASPNDLQQRPIKEEPLRNNSDGKTPTQASKDDDGDHGPGSSAPQSKDGWFSGWLGRLKRNGSKNVHLPDDSNPSIVWDDVRKQWVDVNNPEANESPPPPPPMIAPNPNASSGSVAPTPPSGGLSSPSSGRSGTRSRYVNVLANQTAGSAAAKLDAPLQPPLPTTGYGAVPPMQVSSRQSLQHSEHNLRPPHASNTGDTNNNSNFRMDGGNSGLMMYH